MSHNIAQLKLAMCKVALGSKGARSRFSIKSAQFCLEPIFVKKGIRRMKKKKLPTPLHHSVFTYENFMMKDTVAM